MKVLLVAPRTDLLLVDAEVQRVLRSGLDVTPLLGRVTHTTLFDELAASQCNVAWFCTHGSAEGILLSDGLLPTSLLVPLLRNRVDLVILNTCESIAVAQALQNEIHAEIIATIIEVPDQEAFQTGALLATALAETGDVAAAYEQARPGGNRTYIRLAGVMSVRETQRSKNYQGWPSYAEELDEEMVDLIKAVERLLGEVNLLRYRVQQLEFTTKVGIGLYVATIAIVIAVVLYWR